MDFLVINESKLKITLSKEDAERLRLDPQSASYSTADERRVFRKILDEAEAQVGFISRGDKILIQLYPSRDGGCEIFVTRLALPARAQRAIDSAGNITVLEGRRELYRFSCIADLRQFAAVAAGRGFFPVSDAYITEGACFLDVEENSKRDGQEYFYINEFATRCDGDFRIYLREHYPAIHEGNALSALSAE